MLLVYFESHHVLHFISDRSLFASTTAWPARSCQLQKFNLGVSQDIMIAR